MNDPRGRLLFPQPAREPEQRLLRRPRVRGAALDLVADRFVACLTSAAKLWLAGAHWLDHEGYRALRVLLQEQGVPRATAIEVAYGDALNNRILERCQARARRDWEPLAALAVLGSRTRICFALGLERLPASVAVEEELLEREWLRSLPAGRRRAARRPRTQPDPMGYEPLLEVLLEAG